MGWPRVLAHASATVVLDRIYSLNTPLHHEDGEERIQSLTAIELWPDNNKLAAL